MEPIHYLRIFRRRWKLIAVSAAAALVGVLIAAALTQVNEPEDDSFQATATVLGQGDVPNLSVMAEIVSSDRIAGRVKDELNLSTPREQLTQAVDAATTDQPGILRVTAFSENPARAEALATAFAEEFVTYANETLVPKARQRRSSPRERQRVSVLTARIAELTDRLATLERRMAEQLEQATTETELLRVQAILSVRRDLLEREIGALTTRRDAIVEDLGTAPSPSPAIGTGPTRFELLTSGVAEPVTSDDPAPPGASTIALLGVVFLGILAGFALALLIERLDRRIYTKGQAEESFGRPVIGELPSFPSRRFHVGFRGPEYTATSSVIAATLYNMATGQSGMNRGFCVLVTSPEEDEGKTTLVHHLATAFGQWQKKVLAISLDFHRPSLHKIMGTEADPGTSEILQEDHPSLERFVKQSSMAGVGVIPSGAEPSRLGPLLASPKAADLLSLAANNADIVLIDTSGLFVGGETSFLLHHVDAAVVVARIGATTEEAAISTRELVNRIGLDNVSLVLNGA